jgi:hypothetical protein
MSDTRYITVKEPTQDETMVVVDSQSSSPTPEPIVSDYSYGRNQEPLETSAVRGLDGSVYGLATDSSTQSVGATTTADGTLGTFTLSGVTSTTNALVVPETGTYIVTGGARWSSGADGNLRAVSVTSGGTFISPIQDARPILSANDLYECVSGVAVLTAGDSVKLRVYNGDSSSHDTTYRRLSIVKI